MSKKPYSDSRWNDNPVPRTPYCGYCKHFLGLVDDHLGCKAFNRIPQDIMNDYIVHDRPIKGDHGYQFEPRNPDNVPQLIPRQKIMDYD